MYTPPNPTFGDDDGPGERAPLLNEEPAPTAPAQSRATPVSPPAPSTVAASLPGLPLDAQDAHTFWLLPRNRWLLHSLFVSSVVTLVITFGSSYLSLAMLTGIVGIPAAAIHTVKGFEIKMDTASRTRATSVLALCGLVLSLVTMLQLSWLMFLTNYECRTDPEAAPETLCIADYVWIGSSLLLVLIQAILFKQLLARASVANRFLNPVSSGLVTV